MRRRDRALDRRGAGWTRSTRRKSPNDVRVVSAIVRGALPVAVGGLERVRHHVTVVVERHHAAPTRPVHLCRSDLASIHRVAEREQIEAAHRPATPIRNGIEDFVGTNTVVCVVAVAYSQVGSSMRIIRSRSSYEYVVTDPSAFVTPTRRRRASLEQLMQVQGLPDVWRGRVTTVVAEDADRFSGRSSRRQLLSHRSTPSYSLEILSAGPDVCAWPRFRGQGVSLENRHRAVV
jgi:hypothetical protein